MENHHQNECKKNEKKERKKNRLNTLIIERKRETRIWINCQRDQIYN